MAGFSQRSGRVSARIIRKLGDPVTLPDSSIVSGIFDFATHDGQLERLNINYRTPVLTLTEEDAAKLKIHDAVTINGQVFTTEQPLPDGLGVVEIPLVEQQTDPDSGNWR